MIKSVPLYYNKTRLNKAKTKMIFESSPFASSIYYALKMKILTRLITVLCLYSARSRLLSAGDHVTRAFCISRFFERKRDAFRALQHLRGEQLAFCAQLTNKHRASFSSSQFVLSSLLLGNSSSLYVSRRRLHLSQRIIGRFYTTAAGKK